MENNITDLLNYIDSMMIVDRSLNVIYSYRLNTKLNAGEFSRNDYSDYINKSYFEVYPNLDLNESTMVAAVNHGSVVVRKNQKFCDLKGRVFTTNNITLPIIRLGEIVGAIELSQDITVVGDLNHECNLSKTSKKNHHIITNPDLFSFNNIITKNPEMLEKIRKAKIFALSDNHTLIYGETGTGKELFVQAMVESNPRRKINFVAQNCASIPESIFESLLFGTAKGSFTGAENKIGLFEMADGGILFLDELNSMPLHLQAKLLRVLQDGKVRPVGGRTEKKVDVKVIVATNKNPSILINEKLLREDLFFRLSSEVLYLTALRERKEDIPLYIEYFINQFNMKYKKNVDKMSPSLKNLLLEYHWPGNVRELKHVVESMINVTDESILTIKQLPIYLVEGLDIKENFTVNAKANEYSVKSNAPLKDVLERVEREHIMKALHSCKGNVCRAAEILDIPRQTLKFRMDKLKIENHKI